MVTVLARIVWTLSLMLPLASAPSVLGSDLNALTFNRDIGPIIHRHCAGCHRKDEIGPFPLITYHDVRKRAQMIREVTRTRYMPPWHADPEYSTFVQERRLSDREIEALGRWVEAGAPEGSGEAPRLRLESAVANLGVPDMVVGMREPYEVQGNNRDDWRTFAIPLNLEADVDIKAAVIRPGNRRIVHHAMIYLDESGAGLQLERSSPGYGFSSWQGMKVKVSDILPGLLPGMVPSVYPSGVGKRLPAGAVLLLSMHYAPSPRTETDQTMIELYFADEPLRFQAVSTIINESHLVQQKTLFIPAGETRRFEERRTFDKPITILTLFPHMHYRGKTFRAYATLPGSEDTVPLLKIDAWDFNWQGSYTFRQPVRLPAGATIHVQALFDNTADNPANPVSPPVDAYRGRGSFDEMLGFGLELLQPVSPGVHDARQSDAGIGVAGSPPPSQVASTGAGNASKSRRANSETSSETAGRVSQDGVKRTPVAPRRPTAGSPDKKHSETAPPGHSRTTADRSPPANSADSQLAGEFPRRGAAWLIAGCIALGSCFLLVIRLAFNALSTP